LHGVYLALAETLGSRIGELHQAFALDVEDPAFRPEPVTPEDLAGWQDQVREQARSAEEALRRALEGERLGDTPRYVIESLLGRWDHVDRAIEAFVPEGLEVVKTRLHGDLHLGQVVVVRDDFFVLDFEGEPMKTMDQRRAKQSPLRDVAGMIRSFNYAARTAEMQRTWRPEKEGELRKTLADWEERVVQRFLAGYRTAVAGCPSVPADDAAFTSLVNLFALEKALYEVVYEATNRPDWIGIPAQGVQRVLAAAG
jgi:maltose alpha-D-glucosyltransferase/alpha-amylase